jgi:hypothetical protein
MALRLVLVSAVAGLGLSFPTRTQVTTWVDSAQTWVSARLAAWDAQMPAGEDAFVFVADSAPPASPRVAAVPAAAPVRRPSSPEMDAFFRTDLDLTAGRLTSSEPAEFVWPAPTPLAAKPATTPATTPAAVSDAAFDTAMNAVMTSFTADLPARKVPAIVKADSKPATPTFVPMLIGDDLHTGIALGLDLRPESLNPRLMTTPETTKAPATVLYAPVALNDIVYPILAVALNREAGTQDLIPALRPTPTPTAPAADPSRADRLTHAVQLTREAVYAWANLLHGPAVVTISK